MRAGFCQLRAFSVDRGESYALKELPLSQWVLWFLEWIDATEDQPGQLFGLLAMDRPMDDQVMIEHRLFAYKLGAEQISRKVVSIGQQRHPEFWHARPVCLSPCGRYIAFSLTEKVLRGVSRKGSADSSPEKVYVHKHVLWLPFKIGSRGFKRNARYKRRATQAT